MNCKNCGRQGDDMMTCPNCGAEICESCAGRTDRICPYCYSTLDYKA